MLKEQFTPCTEEEINDNRFFCGHNGNRGKMDWTDRERNIIQKYEEYYKDWDENTPVTMKSICLSSYGYAVQENPDGLHAILLKDCKTMSTGGCCLSVTINYFGRERYCGGDFIRMYKEVRYVTPDELTVGCFDRDEIRKAGLTVVNEEQLQKYFRVGVYHIYDWEEKKEYHFYKGFFVTLDRFYEPESSCFKLHCEQES